MFVANVGFSSMKDDDGLCCCCCCFRNCFPFPLSNAFLNVDAEGVKTFFSSFLFVLFFVDEDEGVDGVDGVVGVDVVGVDVLVDVGVDVLVDVGVEMGVDVLVDALDVSALDV